MNERVKKVTDNSLEHEVLKSESLFPRPNQKHRTLGAQIAS